MSRIEDRETEFCVRHDRRRFMKMALTGSGGLALGFFLPGLGIGAAPTDAGGYAANAWIRIGADESVTIAVAKSEMGQGVATSMPMIVAEELDADWSKVRFEFAPAAPVYAEPERGAQFTGASRSVRKSWVQLREAGASVREMLIAAAANTWSASPQECEAERGSVVHRSSGRRLSYGKLATAAGKLPVPQKPRLKAPKDFKIIGQSLPRLDTPAKVDGSAVYGIDVKLPGMLVALLLSAPVLGAKVKSFDAAKARAVPGVRQVVQIDDGVAVLADTFWQAKLGRDNLEVIWDEAGLSALSSEAIWKSFEAAAQKPGLAARDQQSAAPAPAAASPAIEAVYTAPYLAHACMEPLNCTVDLRPDRCDLWVGTQVQTLAQSTAARITGLPREAVHVHTTFLGGGFGRRLEVDFVAQALQIAKAAGAPVKLVWTREDDMRRGYYRPATYHRLSARLDALGQLAAWQHRIVGPSIFARFGAARMHKDGTDPGLVEGAADLPYSIANVRVEWVRSEPGIAVARWRSVGYSQNIFVVESFIDELAAAAGADPYQFRRRMLEDMPRLRAVLDLAVEKSGWKNPAPASRHRGLALARCYGSFIAEVVEISIDAAGAPRVHRVTAAIDCGIAVNPAGVRAQIESGIVYGLTAALKGEISVRGGRIEQSNFHDYPLLKINEMPDIETHLVPSTEAPGGAGEPGTAPLAAAFANAVFAATGVRVRSLPVRPDALRGASRAG